MVRRTRLASALLIIALLTSCSNDERRGDDDTTPTSERDAALLSPSTQPGVTRSRAKELADEIGCVVEQEIGQEEAPIRGGGAIRGVTCKADGHRLDVFERRPGETDRLDQLLGTDPNGAAATCGWVLVGEDWAITSNDRDYLDGLARLLDGVVRNPAPASPPASYEIPGCAQGRPKAR